MKYFKRYDFEKYTSFNISYEANKSNNKNYDYIANSQCCGLYSYGKLSKESKLRKLITPSETDIHRGQKVFVFFSSHQIPPPKLFF